MEQFTSYKATYDNSSYYIIYLYLKENDSKPNNILIFKNIINLKNMLDMDDKNNVELMFILLNLKIYGKTAKLTSQENKLVKRFIKKQKRDFKNYLNSHVHNFGEILHWNMINNYGFAYVFDKSLLTKIFIFKKEYPNDFQLINNSKTASILDIDLTYATTEFLQDLLIKSNLKSQLFIQVSTAEFLAITKIDDYYGVADICTLFDKIEVRYKLKLNQRKITKNLTSKDVQAINASVENFIKLIEKTSKLKKRRNIQSEKEKKKEE